jgi:TRAP-type C4-dicarboxylate transport system permease small subunit
MFAIGSLALLGAMATDFIGVVGRHLGWTPLGLVEIVQLCVVGAISASIVVATLQGAHAAVHMITERLPPALARRLAQASDLLGAALFALLAAGSAWLLGDTWPLDERSDVLNLPIAPARIVWTGALLLTSAIFLVRGLRTAALPHPDAPGVNGRDVP